MTPATQYRLQAGAAAGLILGIVGLVSQVRSQTRPALSQPSQSLWLTMPEAAAASGLSIGLLQRLVAAHKLPAIRDGAVKVRRADLNRISQSARTLKDLAAELRHRRRA